MILSDASIRSQIDGEYITLDPPIDEEQIQPASLDLRLGEELYDVTVDNYQTDETVHLIRPGAFYLGHTRETIELPGGIAGMVTGRSSYGREGIIVHATAGFVDPGFRGQVTLEIYNFSNAPVPLPVGERVCQMVFLPLDMPAETPYGEERDSQYQDQSGATPSRLT